MSLLLTLPFEIRLQVWTLVVGPHTVEPCKVSTTRDGDGDRTRICRPEKCGRENFNIYTCLDTRLLRVNRQIHDEVRPLLMGLTGSPKETTKRFVVCDGVCLERLFLGTRPQDRRWIRYIQVRLFVGDARPEVLLAKRGHGLLEYGEACCGAFVQSALSCSGVGGLVDAVPSEKEKKVEVEEDERGRRTLWVDLVLG
ncbi:hypothetical protein A1O1_07283 [Capronia coronata CBS 617.96]|uniref:Uncharacterized protein n=1 Tax=Capronia coronata CBS 617.96 TaxID=1182541 RepID=W9YN17_9EURO|nr:uncharacterized protein A1O1_07283 [Capronia coronata CBS 617.96]EXJ83659.1 hypothetical protein A1O1_07283 [Capronia coronata CBS 617.96]